MRRTTSLKSSLRAIERAFGDIERFVDDLSKRVRAAERGAGGSATVTAKPRRKLTITPKRRAQLKLQGVYMTYMRQLGPRQKARVRAVKEKRGFEAAIGVARKFAG